ncbi:4-hydroxybenzoate 3-monooxygenase [Streptomyces olivaceus]|uniref:4-hydroxybenzoate 3-monooxygenase n=1 Tax=Streptomyces olivaceus TaxID=47716 RepID=UPI000878AAB3|nr:4-hydroxybenzoate 3-monooxygenase [Streptomyces olivaceus]AOW87375.1 4-hydroxybenzoate 3-monooxygenase [Streptomyces olivaceus]MBZ6295120.1 4-hydroxybenzoate 3-monooxygenase [Streptomyces olivaceus]MBZ6330124.1 4-hydroxybenzoate 3-monooxygenase [Streptomyces olivaceus]GHJ02712.1 4-hydroxybenzoate 3-monooxygenase [Streptomyces olivaceus]
MRTTVGIIGAGPAGLLLARLLHNAGIDSVVLESRDRSYVEHRQRAGILEQGTVDVLRAAGAGERMDREGLRHDGIELRFAGRRHRVDFPALTGGRSVMVYAQTEVCKDLIALQLAGGGPLLFEAEALAVEGAETDRPRVRFRRGGPDGAEDVLECDYVVGCDGFWGVARAAVPDGRTFERAYPYGWLGVLADVAPSHDELVYARHDRGFALLSMRSPSVSRLYLQVPADTDADSWSDDEIWAELERRFETRDDWTLDRGPITQKSVTPMRSYVHEPMRHGRLFLAGDAAHIVPPTGAKGLNLAVGDVVTLARALAHRTGGGSDELLDAYSATCLRRVWQAERFSYDMTTLLHRAPGATPFDDRLQLARLDRFASSRAAETDLAEAYTGFPIG